MLLFVDQPKTIKVFRLEQSERGTKRVRIGSVQKGKMQINDELRSALNTEESAEVLAVIDIYNKTDSIQMRLDISRFPEAVRNVVTYIGEGDASELEKRVLTTALVDAVRTLRKIDAPVTEPV